MPFGDRIREERTRVGLSMQQLADRCDVTLRSQGNYERSEREPTREYLARLDEAGMDVLYVVTGRRAGDARSGDEVGAKERTFLQDFRELPDAGRKVVTQMVATLRAAFAEGKRSVDEGQRN